MESSARYNFFVKSLVLLFVFQHTVNVTYAATEKCRGAFDVYFVLDRSSSLIKQGRNYWRSDVVPFVENLSKMFVSPLLRMSYITFADTAVVVMPLTSDRNILDEKLEDLKRVIPEGPTLMHLGIEKANQQITSSRDRRASVIIALTDGKLEYFSKIKSVDQANKARSLGSTVFMVGVSRYDEKQLLEIAGKRKYLFEASDFSKLSVIADQILDSSCVEILSANPSTVCINETFNVHIYGNGFMRNGDTSRTMCNFWSNEGNGIRMKAKQVTDTFLSCESPKDFTFDNEQTITVQVSLNEGLSFISSNVTIEAYKCVMNTTYLWLAFLLLFLLAWTGLWWIWNFLACKRKRAGPEEPRPSRPPPPPPPPSNQGPEPKHWPAVDASYYGGAGAGGIKPVPVRWGDKGCTEAAAHLERTKDAKEIVVNVNTEADENANDVKPKPSDSICTKLFSPFAKCYAWMESKRPTNEEVKNCICIRKT